MQVFISILFISVCHHQKISQEHVKNTLNMEWIFKCWDKHDQQKVIEKVKIVIIPISSPTIYLRTFFTS